MDDPVSENIDSDLESESSSDEKETVESAGVKNSDLYTGEYKKITINEENLIEEYASYMIKEKVITDEVDLQSGNTLEEIINKNKETDTETLNILRSVSRYRDITPMFVDGTPFLIDASSLVTCVMQDKNYCTSNGGQTLHFIYLAERIIDLICRKGGTCELVFFRDKEVVFQELPEYSLLFSALKVHITKNTDIISHEMDSVFCLDFKRLVSELIPCFIVLDYDATGIFELLLKGKKANLAKRLFLYYELYVLTLGLYSVDITYIELFKNQMFSFSASPLLKELNVILQSNLVGLSNICFKEFPVLTRLERINLPVNKFKNIKQFVAVQVANRLYNKKDKQFFIKNEDLFKLYLFYSVLLESLPLKFRNINLFCKPIDEISVAINEVIKLIGSFLKSSCTEDYDCYSIADVWHGNLFMYSLWLASSPSNFSYINSKVVSQYKYLMELFNNISGNNFNEFPVLSNESCQRISDLFQKNNLKLEIGNKQVLYLKNIKIANEQYELDILKSDHTTQPLNNVVKQFCSDIIPLYYSTEQSSVHIKKNYQYEKMYHWYSMEPLTNVFDRIVDHNQNIAHLPLKKQLRSKATLARYMMVYGKNLMGKSYYEPIVVCQPSNNNTNIKKKQRKENKTSSKKSLQIINDNILRRQKETQEKEKHCYENCLKLYKSDKLNTHNKLDIINQTLLNLSMDEMISKLLFNKIDVLFQLWRDERANGDGDKNLNLANLKELFLTIKKLLLLSSTASKPLLVEKQNQKLGSILCRLGFKEIAIKWNLPIDVKEKSNLSINMSHVRFQLTHLGSDLERKLEGKPDDRVVDFIPDPWQKKLFDIVDRHESALIVAPTSSGKTYASYYCMKKILKESNEGRVVYVSPTKALVNQVAATIYAKFKNKNMPPGMSLYGVFTKDYKMNPTDCQILITVPESLEILLMSPNHYSWAKSLKYVIFDEIHCLAAQAGEGMTWERCLMLIQCPFLALSATIENPREFVDWMISIEHCKKNLDSRLGNKVNLVIHSDRHNDLVNYVYGSDNKLHHIHPYANLSDRIVKVYGGIPSHLSLDPNETIQLYDVMCSVDPSEESLLKLNPDEYFCSSVTGFILREDVKEYQKKLKLLLENWYKTKHDLFISMVDKLYQPVSQYTTKTKGYKFFNENIVEFTKYLQSNDMLPALFFSFNRGYCDGISSDLTEYFTNIEEEYKAKEGKKKSMLQTQYEEEEYDEKEHKSKKRSNANKKEEGRSKRDVNSLFPVGLTDCDRRFSLRGKHNIDNKDLQFIEKRLNFRGYGKEHCDVNKLRRGVGKHHAGLKTIIRQSVEMLFRLKFLNVVFATGTLALGVHVPCKSVIIMGDSAYLNTQEFQQMSGRAGRRGYDKSGNVVFYGLDADRMRALTTSKLPRIIGNFPLSVCTVLRLFLLLSKVSDETNKNNEYNNDTVMRVLTVLNEGLLYRTEKNLKDQMKHFVLMSCKLLMLQELIDLECRPSLLSGLITHIHYYEPGNLAFTHLLRTGVLAKMCKLTSEGEVNSSACYTLVNLLARLFTFFPIRRDSGKNDMSIVKLPPLPDYVAKALETYNNEVQAIYTNYYKGISITINKTIGEDVSLPLSKKQFVGCLTLEDLCASDEQDNPTFEMLIAGNSKQNLICSAFAGLSGITDENMYCQSSLISNIRHQVFTDTKVVPLLDLNKEINGYAYDFFRHGDFTKIITENGLSCGQDYAYLNEFRLVIKSINRSLQEMGMFNSEIEITAMNEKEVERLNINRCVSMTLSKVKYDYESAFNKTYDILEKLV